ncbi:MAG: hypothetical protein HOV94_36260, partial [Saccharothrix sp.]|nr:hypothetical protein [Saccharothrix sp.]
GVLDLTGGPALADTAAACPQVRHVTATSADAPAPALLIRPDGYVAWAGEDDLGAALTRWFGPA